MKHKAMYCISGFIANDENVAYVTIFKLISLGRNNKRYVWIAVNGDISGGLGTAIDNWGDEDIESAFVKMTRFTDERYTIIKGTFDEALSIYNEILEGLNSTLKTNEK
jgi:hypothetical protein